MCIWKWGKENVQVLFSDKDLSEIRNAMSEDILIALNIPKTIHCLIFTFRATNAVLDPDRAQPSWGPWAQERPLLKLSNMTGNVPRQAQLRADPDRHR